MQSLLVIILQPIDSTHNSNILQCSITITCSRRCAIWNMIVPDTTGGNEMANIKCKQHSAAIKAVMLELYRLQL